MISSTYRIQFHKEFTFSDFEAIIPYLEQLGIRTIYASPIFESMPGSTHGYDSVNPHCINPEIGTIDDFRRIREQLSEKGMSWLQDIVPNHMAYHPNNPWIRDVLQLGTRSVYANFFDIDWNHPDFRTQVMVPFLGSPVEELLSQGEISFDLVNQELVVKVGEAEYPVSPETYHSLLTSIPSAASLVETLDTIQKIEDPGAYGLAFREQFLQAFSQNDSVVKALQKRVRSLNPQQIQEELARQAYVLCTPDLTNTKINYRRFFTVNDLICLNIQRPEVFDHFHSYLFSLIEEGLIQGIRIDHIDGLFDPTGYLEKLREKLGDSVYITVEKILESGEPLPSHWPIQGNTGYDFLTSVNNLLVSRKSSRAFTDYYETLVGKSEHITDQAHTKKNLILTEYMGGELDNLVRLYQQLDLPTIPEKALASCLTQWLVYSPVYRYYANQWPFSTEEKRDLKAVFQLIRKHPSSVEKELNTLEEVLLTNENAFPFYQRCMQFSGPLMAKGLEDTLFYTHNRMIGLNEVGNSPEDTGLTFKAFHQQMQERQEQWPLTQNATATHDTKRGEDIRARLSVLSDIPEQWFAFVDQQRAAYPDDTVTPNDQYFVYQMLAGAYPMPGQNASDFAGRLEEYFQKAVREAKENSSWTEPDEAYETALANFTHTLLDQKGTFWKNFEPFHRQLSDWGIIQSLSQVVLKYTVPGIPDLYQGCEGWDLNLVDPDNRRPVDYSTFQDYLNEEFDPKNWWNQRYTGQIKTWLTQKLLQQRQETPEVFTTGLYIPLTVEGAARTNILAFVRRYEKTWILVVVPLHAAQLTTAFEDIDWKDTRVILPPEAPFVWGDFKLNSESELLIRDLFQELPFAVLKGEPAITDRNAGILLSLTSLPSEFGIGDMGPEAYAFADFMARSRQHYWQLLPLNPTGADQGYSPYSSVSSRAGNPLLISPEVLVADGLLTSVERYRQPATSKVDYAAATDIRTDLLRKAYEQFCSKDDFLLRRGYETFCTTEVEWLDDYAVYILCKQVNDQKPWYEWPDEYKFRDEATLEQLKSDHAEELVFVKWVQFIFFHQWNKLKSYCNVRNIHLFGDLPFYPSYDSVDVWANRDLFHLDEKGQLTCVAGVPPDYFNEDGQRWGMPIYRWDVLKARNYDWWVTRISTNMDLYNRLRLDHFRAFASYWEVPAHEKSAKNGEWKPGPGSDFFRVLQERIGPLSLVAEDLGDIAADVYILRDEFMLPGMRVLHFAFHTDMPISVNIPHNHTALSVAYTGTHDNNTTRGWFRKDVTTDERRRLEEYLGGPLSEETIHYVLIRIAYASVAQTTIIPIQDLLGLDESARMNTPAGMSESWVWRLKANQLPESLEKQLRKWAWTYHRG